MRARAMASKNAPPRLAMARPLVQRALRSPGRSLTPGAAYSLAHLPTHPARSEPQPTLARIGGPHDAAEDNAERAAHGTVSARTAWSARRTQTGPVHIHSDRSAAE